MCQLVAWKGLALSLGKTSPYCCRRTTQRDALLPEPDVLMPEAKLCAAVLVDPLRLLSLRFLSRSGRQLYGRLSQTISEPSKCKLTHRGWPRQGGAHRRGPAPSCTSHFFCKTFSRPCPYINNVLTKLKCSCMSSVAKLKRGY